MSKGQSKHEPRGAICPFCGMNSMATADEDDARLRDAMRTVLTHPAGLGIELAADLWLDRLEDGRFRVAEYGPGGKMLHEELFDDVDRAIIRYLIRRDERRLGPDYEGSGCAK